MTRLAINPIACRGFGVCAELLPEEVRLDEWGYPIMERRQLGVELLEHARRAVAECPTMALRLVDDTDAR